MTHMIYDIFPAAFSTLIFQIFAGDQQLKAMSNESACSDLNMTCLACQPSKCVTWMVWDQHLIWFVFQL